MLVQLIYFGASFALGLALGLLYWFFLLIFNKLKNRAAIVTVQFLLAATGVTAFTLLTFFANDGKFTPYAAISLLTGFCLPNLLLKKTLKAKP